MSNQATTNNLDYLNDPIFSRVNRLFVLSFENEEDITSFSNYYTQSIEIKHFSVLINRKNVFDVPIKIKKKHPNE